MSGQDFRSAYLEAVVREKRQKAEHQFRVGAAVAIGILIAFLWGVTAVNRGMEEARRVVAERAQY